MDTAFVIGGAGFVGRHLVRHLAARGLRVVATCRPGGEPPAVAGGEWVPSDLAAADPTGGWPRRYDTLITLAQSSQRREFPAGANDMFRVNVAAVHRAVEHARSAGARRLINMSTGTVYAQTGQPARETESFSVAEPRSFYAASKLAVEFLLAPYAA